MLEILDTIGVPSTVSIPTFTTSSTGQGSFASGGDYSIPLDAVPATYVSALTNRASTGIGGALLPTSLFASGHCGQYGLTDPRSITGIHNGLRLSVHVAAASPSDLVTYQVVGGALALFTLQETVHESPIGAGHYIIWSHGSTNWWDLLPIGHFTSVQSTIDQELAVFVPSTSTGGTPRVLDQNGGVVAVSGMRLAG